MKCLITGHTRGIGKAIYECLLHNGFIVEGISKSTGTDISKSYDDILEKAVEFDLFINNACVDDYQYRFLNDLNNKVKNIITIGSTAGYHSDILHRKQDYATNKCNLIKLNQKLSYTSYSNLLLLNIGLTENASTEPGCTYEDITETIVFWLKRPNISQIDFSIKLSTTNIDLIEQDFQINLTDHRDKFF